MMPLSSPYSLEICVETPTAIDACVGIADRIELCAGLDVGGLTPSIGMMEYANLSGVETHVLIRPMSGDFQMGPSDIAVAVTDIRKVRDMGLHGVVIGAERDGVLDRKALDAMVRAADGLEITLHRVIDILSDPVGAMEVAIGYGFTRILSSGGGASAHSAMAQLREMHQSARGRVEVMAGAGVNSANIADIIEQTDLTSFHASCSYKARLDHRYASFGFGEVERSFDRDELAKLAACLNVRPT
jgi:copper homeostasis protein